jgi:hypothetical protein
MIRSVTTFLFLAIFYTAFGQNSHINMLKNAPVIHEQPCDKEMEFKQSICSFKDIDTVRYIHANTSPVHDFESVKADIDATIVETFLRMANKVAIEDSTNIDVVIKYEYLDGIGGTLAKASYPSCNENHLQVMTFDNYDVPYGVNTPDSVKIYYTNPKDIVHIARHELGHILGLEHDVVNEESLMYPYYEEGKSWSPLDSLSFYLMFGPTDFISLKKEDVFMIRPNFNIAEFFSKCEGMNFHMLDKRLIVMAQKLRDYYGSGVIITSSYRHKKCNEKAGGAKKSQHKAGRALDFKFTNPAAHIRFSDDIRKFQTGRYTPFVISILKNGKIGGIGLYNTHIHMDTRSQELVWNKGIFDMTNNLIEDGDVEKCGL